MKVGIRCNILFSEMSRNLKSFNVSSQGLTDNEMSITIRSIEEPCTIGTNFFNFTNSLNFNSNI